MATITPILDTRYATKNGYPVKVRIIVGDKQKNISIGYRIAKKYWVDGEVVGHPDADIINGVIWEKMDAAKRYIADCAIKNRPVNIDFIGSSRTSYSFIDYLQHRADQYRAKQQIVMRRKLEQFVKQWKACFKKDVYFDELNNDLLTTYDAWLIKKGNCKNTRSKKFKMLKEIVDRARNDGKMDGENPFNNYHIGTDPVRKEKLSLPEIQALENLELQPGAIKHARDLFLFSYYIKGMRFEKCVTLLRNQIRDGRVYIQMNKGKKFISVKIHGRLQRILDQYAENDIVFPLLSAIPDNPEEYLRAVDSQNVIVNRNLKLVAGLAGIKKNLTFHMARHTLAQHLKQNNSSIHAIKEALGHSDTRTTEIYLESLGDERIDNEMAGLYGE